MKKNQFSTTQIASILNELDCGKSAEEISRDRGVSKATLYNWRKKYGGMGASEMKRVTELEEKMRA